MRSRKHKASCVVSSVYIPGLLGGQYQEILLVLLFFVTACSLEELELSENFLHHKNFSECIGGDRLGRNVESNIPDF